MRHGTHLLLTSELQSKVRPNVRRRRIFRSFSHVAHTSSFRPRHNHIVLRYIGTHQVLPLQRRPTATLGVRDRDLAPAHHSIVVPHVWHALTEIAPFRIPPDATPPLRVGIAVPLAKEVVGVIRSGIVRAIVGTVPVGGRAAIHASRAGEGRDARSGIDYHRLTLGGGGAHVQVDVVRAVPLIQRADLVRRAIRRAPPSLEEGTTDVGIVGGHRRVVGPPPPPRGNRLRRRRRAVVAIFVSLSQPRRYWQLALDELHPTTMCHGMGGHQRHGVERHPLRCSSWRTLLLLLLLLLPLLSTSSLSVIVGGGGRR
jgi:hypothetical protein